MKYWGRVGFDTLYMCLNRDSNAYAGQNFAGTYMTAVCNRVSGFHLDGGDVQIINPYTIDVSCPSGYTGYLTMRNLAMIDPNSVGSTPPAGKCVGYMYVCYANWAM